MRTPLSHSSSLPSSSTVTQKKPFEQKRKAMSDNESNVFNFGESRVREYLSSLSSSSSSDSSRDCPLSTATFSFTPLTPPPKRKKYSELASKDPLPSTSATMPTEKEKPINELVQERLVPTQVSEKPLICGPLTRAKKRQLDSESSSSSSTSSSKKLRESKPRKHKYCHHQHLKRGRHRAKNKKKYGTSNSD